MILIWTNKVKPYFWERHFRSKTASCALVIPCGTQKKPLEKKQKGVYAIEMNGFTTVVSAILGCLMVSCPSLTGTFAVLYVVGWNLE